MERGSKFLAKITWRSSGALVLLLILVACCAVTRAAEPRDPVLALFELDRQGAPGALDAIRANYTKLKSRRVADPRFEYAFGLLLAKHGKYADALPHMRAWVASKPADWQARCTLLWTEIQARQYDEFGKDALSLSETLRGDASRVGEKDQLQIARQLGAQCKYLELVRPQAIGPQERLSLRTRILRERDEAFVAAFGEGGHAVVETLSEMRDQREQQIERKAEAARDRVEKARTTIAEEQNRLEMANDRVEAGSESLVEAQRKLSLLEHQISALAWDQTQLGARMVVVQAQFADLAKSLDLGWVSGRPSDPIQTTRTNRLSPWDPRSIELAGLVNSMTTLRRQSLALDRKLLDLHAQAAEARRQGALSADKVARGDYAATDAERRATRLQKQLDAQRTESKPHPAAITGRMALLSTYLPSPYEAEKKRILAGLAK